MKINIKIMLLTVSLIVSSGIQANSATGVFASCMVDNLNGKERKNLAKWIFFSIAAHPEIKMYSSATQTDLSESDKYIGSLITRLLTENCPNELKAANKVDPQAIEKGFELVGQVAMQELMNNQEVMTTLTKYVEFTDQNKINKVLTE